MSKIIEAPAFVQHQFEGSMMKSLHKTGNCVVSDICCNLSKLPPKYRSSVNTEIAFAP